MSADMLNNLKIAGEMDTEKMGVLNHTIAHGMSFLAAMYMEKEYDQTVCKSGAGYHIGCVDEEGMPVARDSVEHWATVVGAHDALRDRSWTQRMNP